MVISLGWTSIQQRINCNRHQITHITLKGMRDISTYLIVLSLEAYQDTSTVTTLMPTPYLRPNRKAQFQNHYFQCYCKQSQK